MKFRVGIQEILKYAATDMEAKFCKNKEAVIVGGGNSARQAVMYLCRYANHGHIIAKNRALEGMVHTAQKGPKELESLFSEDRQQSDLLVLILGMLSLMLRT